MANDILSSKKTSSRTAMKTWLLAEIDTEALEGFRKVVKHTARAILFFVVTITVKPLVLALRVICSIRIGYFTSSRIGHFAPDVAWYLATKGKEESVRKFVDLFFLEPTACNDAFEVLVRRRIRAIRVSKRLYQILTSSPSLENCWLQPARNMHGSRDPDGRVFKAKEAFSFSKEENTAGWRYLSKYNISRTSEIICLMVRDGEYLRQVNKEKGLFRGTSYHDYRNADIEAYVETAEYLAKKGYVVFRMGKYMEQPLVSTHPNVVDYAFSDDRCDLLDIWLMANCGFCISTGTGLDAIATIFKRPTVYVDLLPLGDLWSSQHCITVPKKLSWTASGRLLSVHEYMEHNHHDSEGYSSNGIEVNALTPREILAAVTEMEQRLNGVWKGSDDDDRRQTQFWEVFRSSPSFAQNHEWINPKAIAGANFLFEHQQELLL